jgi:hypothetical protein
MKTDKEILYDWAKEKNINRKECIHAHYEWWALIEFSKYYQQQVKSYDSLDNVVQQSELLIGLLTMLEKEGGNNFIDKAEIVAKYQANL